MEFVAQQFGEVEPRGIWQFGVDNDDGRLLFDGQGQGPVARVDTLGRETVLLQKLRQQRTKFTRIDDENVHKLSLAHPTKCDMDVAS